MLVVSTLCTGLLAAAFVAPPAQAFEKAIWGPGFRNGVSLFPIYHQLGATIYEDDLRWNQVAPERPLHPTNPAAVAYHWPIEVSRAIAQARRYHMRVMLQIIGAPAWANGGEPWNWAPRRADDFAAFAAAAARRYPNVHLWMIWGEPNHAIDFQPLTPALPGATLDAAQQVAPHTYARLLDAAYGALKRASRQNLVIGGCTYSIGDIDTLQWIENLRLPDGRPPRMDLYAHNPFGFRAPNFSNPPSPSGLVDFSDLQRLTRWIDEYLHPGLRLFLSEWTIPTGVDTQFNFYVDPSIQAQWISDGLRLARSDRRIYALGWINLYDDPPESYGGLIDTRGRHKPGFAAFANG
jgi:hypothetical protein